LTTATHGKERAEGEEGNVRKLEKRKIEIR